VDLKSVGRIERDSDGPAAVHEQGIWRYGIGEEISGEMMHDLKRITGCAP